MTSCVRPKVQVRPTAMVTAITKTDRTRRKYRTTAARTRPMPVAPTLKRSWEITSYSRKPVGNSPAYETATLANSGDDDARVLDGVADVHECLAGANEIAPGDRRIERPRRERARRPARNSRPETGRGHRSRRRPSTCRVGVSRCLSTRAVAAPRRRRARTRSRERPRSPSAPRYRDRADRARRGRGTSRAEARGTLERRGVRPPRSTLRAVREKGGRERPRPPGGAARRGRVLRGPRARSARRTRGARGAAALGHWASRPGAGRRSACAT